MEITQVYLFTGADFVRRANEFLSHPVAKRTIVEPKVRCNENFIAIIITEGWMHCEEIWQVYQSYT